jgi:carbonic anhydrase
MASEQPGVDSSTALARLKKGNARAAAGKPTHPDQSIARRKALAREQHPFAIVVSCSDSRVPPELALRAKSSILPL